MIVSLKFHTQLDCKIS